MKEKFGGEIPKIDLFQVDLTDRSAIDKVFDAYKTKGGIWGVIHLAVSRELVSKRDRGIEADRLAWALGV